MQKENASLQKELNETKSTRERTWQRVKTLEETLESLKTDIEKEKEVINHLNDAKNKVLTTNAKGQQLPDDQIKILQQKTFNQLQEENERLALEAYHKRIQIRHNKSYLQKQNIVSFEVPATSKEDIHPKPEEKKTE